MPPVCVRRSVAPLLLCLAATACDAPPDRSPEGDRTPKERTYIAMHEDSVRAMLRDPKAAEFRGVRVYYGVAPMVCGEVSATNAFGGRRGFQRFISGGEIHVLEEQMGPGEMDKLWPKVCY